MKQSVVKTVIYTLLALIAFAGNSILCRLAIGADEIDANSFTLIRVFSGALTLGVLMVLLPGTDQSNRFSSNWKAAVMLLIYAVAFSYAYIRIDTGVGALVLFGAVQITLVLHGFIVGERLGVMKCVGLAAAFSGLVYLLLPDSQTASMSVSVSGFMLMLLSGIAWGIYTLLGKASRNPLADTAHNFLKAAVLSLLLIPFALQSGHLSYQGGLLAMASGVITSGLGYTIWYHVVPKLSSIQAGVVQLSVPIVAALGGVIFIGELLSQRLLIAMFVTLLGILLVIYAPSGVSLKREDSC